MRKIDLEELYYRVKEEIAKVDFSTLWEGFIPLKFAIYDDEKCFFDGRYVEKTIEFCANTAIEYQGENIAIWNVQEELPPSVFASFIIHEMFHAFQEKEGWDCWADEREAPFKYKYSAENLSLKLRESRLLLGLLDHFDREKYEKLLACRKYRSEKFPYEFGYECSIEAIEGSANYVEWQVLEQLDGKEAKVLTDYMREKMVKPEYYFPIRICGYYTGALMINAMIQAGDLRYGAKDQPVIRHILEDLKPVTSVDMGDEEDVQRITEAVDSYFTETRTIIEKAVADNDVVATGPLDLVSVNIADARFYDGYLTSHFFVRFRENGEDKLLRDNFVLKMKDEKTIDTVYRWV